MARAPARIAWSPDGTRFVSRLLDHRIRLHAEDGSVIRSLGRALDAQWDADRVISIDDRGTIRIHGARGVEAQSGLRYNPDVAWLAPPHLVIASSREVIMVDTRAREDRWRLDHVRHDLPPPAHVGVAVSANGTRVAVAYTAERARVSGRGFAVIEVATDTVLDRDFIEIGALVDAPIGLAFDRDGRRFAITHPEAFPGLGVIELGAPGDRIRGHRGGVRAVALDARGMIAAYAEVKRVQFDFLHRDALGVSVEVESTLAFDVELPDVIALGFDPDSRWLACLASTGAIEIVPVP